MNVPFEMSLLRLICRRICDKLRDLSNGNRLSLVS